MPDTRLSNFLALSAATPPELLLTDLLGIARGPFTPGENYKITVADILGLLDVCRPDYVELTYAATMTLDFDAGCVQFVQLTGDLEILGTSNRTPPAGRAKEMVLWFAAPEGADADLIWPADWIVIREALPASIAQGLQGALSLTCRGTDESDIIAVEADEQDLTP